MAVGLTSVIAAKASGTYWSVMAAAILRLLALVALVLMPIGMAGGPAMAMPTPADHVMTQATPGHHAMTQQMPADHATMPMGHCDEQPGEDNAPPSKMDCMAMCTAMLATAVLEPGPVMKLAAPRSLALSRPFSGIEPELATPPPRRV